jgi:hypothetical protein
MIRALATAGELPPGRGHVRQMLGRAAEAWGAESGNDRLVMAPARERY